MEQRHDLDERDAQDSGLARNPAVRNKGKKPIALDDVDTLVDDKLSSSSSPNPSPIKSKSNKERTRHRHSSDSQMVVEQINEEYEARDQRMTKYVSLINL